MFDKPGNVKLTGLKLSATANTRQFAEVEIRSLNLYRTLAYSSY